MRIAQKISEQLYLLDGNEVDIVEIFRYTYRIHKANGDIEIYDSVDDMPAAVESFDLDNYKHQVNDAHSLLYQSLWQTRDYKDENEISLYADLVVDENTTERQLQWKEEAITLRNYYLLTTDILYNYFDTVTEETAISVEEFIQTLPIFNG